MHVPCGAAAALVFPFSLFPCPPKAPCPAGIWECPDYFPAVMTQGKGVWTAPNPLRCCPQAFPKPGQPQFVALGFSQPSRPLLIVMKLLLPPGKMLFCLDVKCEAVLAGPRSREEHRGVRARCQPMPPHQGHGSPGVPIHQHRGQIPLCRAKGILPSSRTAGLSEGGWICQRGGSAWILAL